MSWPVLALVLATTLLFSCLLACLGAAAAFATPTAAASALSEPVGDLWKGDAAQPLYEQWASMSDQEHCAVNTSSSNLPDSRVTLVTDSRFAKGVAVRYHMNAGDKSCFSGRSELAMGTKFGETWPYLITRGHEGWYAFQALFPSDYPLNSSTVADGGVMQFHGYGGEGKVPFGISAGRNCDGSEGPGTPHAGGSELGWMKAWVRVTSTEYKQFCLSKEIRANAVYDIVIHARFTEEANGFCEVFLNGTRVLDFTGPFGFVPTANTILRSGLYPDTARSESPAIDLYEGGWTLAGSREAAELNAFGAGQLPAPEPAPAPQPPPPAETASHKPKDHGKGNSAPTVLSSSQQPAGAPGPAPATHRQSPRPGGRRHAGTHHKRRFARRHRHRHTARANRHRHRPTARVKHRR